VLQQCVESWLPRFQVSEPPAAYSPADPPASPNDPNEPRIGEAVEATDEHG